MSRILLPALLFASACFVPAAEHHERLAAFDMDGDGYIDSQQGGDDCDDADAAVHPDQAEICNGVDDDCNGTIDDDLFLEGYLDEDGDGYGTGELVQYCTGETGFTDNADDCDDTDLLINPEAFDDCGGIDEDCNGITDDPGDEHWADTDGDGFGDPDGDTDFFCTTPDEGWAPNVDDCDDTDGLVNPDGQEICSDGIDNNCNGIIDTDGEDTSLAWLDTDGDGWGDGPPVSYCGTPPAGHATQFGDCDPNDGSVNPDADDICNGIDDNCDSLVDNGADAFWYIDADNDGYGDGTFSLQQCSDPGAGWSANPDDCDDSRATVNPTGAEVCANGADDDCDGTTDDSPASPIYWADSDGDGYGDSAAPSDSCNPGAGFVQNQQDCDDVDSAINPVADETCADLGVDNDCNGDASEEGGNRPTWYLDQDNDGYGDVGSPSSPQCIAPNNHVADNTDCDDLSGVVNPGESEVCNHIDDNCDGVTDTDAIDKMPFYVDGDGDGYGDTAQVDACFGTDPGVSETNDDCDDVLASVNPGATEACNNIDDDCNNLVDDGAQPVNWYLDADDDGFGDDATSPILQCEDPSSGGTDYVLTAGDCDDSLAAVNPAGAELCATVGVDDDCDGNTNDANAADINTFYVDSDNDGHGQQGASAQLSCEAPAGTVASNDDCNDANNTISPSDPERCSTVGVDDNCNGNADEASAVDAQDWYNDGDSDGYGAGSATHRCFAGSLVASNDDCLDTNAAVNPGATELCSTVGVDDDCANGADDSSASDTTTFYRDLDSDGVGLAADGTQDACSAPGGYVISDGDCDNNEANEYPGNTEIPYNGYDDDCVGGDQCDVDLDGLDALACAGGTDCDDTTDTILECADFPYTPPNVDPSDYTPAAPVDFTGCSGTMTLNMENGGYNSNWTNCTTAPTPVEVTMSNGQPAYVLATEGWIQPAGVEVDPVDNDRALIILVYGDAVIDGVLDAGGTDGGSGPGGNRDHCVSIGTDGTGTGDGGGGGGGGGGMASNGANGGDGDSGTNGTGGTSPTGNGYQPLIGGCQGGWGGYGSNSSNSNWAGPGYGGGAIQVSVSGELDVGGSVWAGGGGGQRGDAAEGGGGGGGGGGTIFLQADDLIVDGDLGANGGGGGGGASSNTNGNAGESGSRTSRPQGGSPGPSAGRGGNGADGSNNASAGANSSGEGGGGGGGGVGVIYLRGLSSCSIGSVTANPTPTTSCP